MVSRPGELWVESSNDNGLLPLRMATQSAQTEQTQELLVQRPSSDSIDLNVWISDRPADPCGVLIRDRDFLHFEDLAPAKWHLSDGVVRLESARIERHSVADRSGNVKDQPCLVLRGACPEGSFFRFRTVGVPYAGQDEQCFASAGRFTLRQWPVTRGVVEKH